MFDGLTVRENIWLAASRIHSGEQAKRVVDEMLERIGLDGRWPSAWSASSPTASGNGSNSASCCRPIPN